MANDIIDINVYETVETVAITVNPNLTTVNINQVTSSSGGANLTTSQTSSNFTINSDTGTDAIVPLGNGTLAGATLNDYTTAEKNKLVDTYTKSEVDTKITGVYKVKGSVANYASLPSSGQVIGDVWNLLDTGANYVWTGTVWDELGATVDISGKENSANKQNSLAVDGTGTKFPTVDAVNFGITNSSYWTKTGNHIQNNNTELVKIGGTVSSGTSNQKLHVNGSIICSDKILTNSGSGFVFSDASTGMGLSGNEVRFTSYLGGGGNAWNFNPIYLASTSGNLNILNFSNTINPTSGTGVFNTFNISPTINQTGGANGITRGIYINPTLTSAANFRAIEVTVGKVIVPNGVASNEAVNKGQIDSGFVPYTGAISDVNLGEFGIQLGNLEFDNTPTNIPTTAGSMYYNDTDGTLDLILKGGNVKLQIGQESVVRVVNKTATNIDLLEANYQAVRITGAQGQRMKVDLAQATNDVLSSETIGLVTETIANNAEGFVTTSGLVRNINTTGSLQSETWADGDILYLSPTVAGRITKVKPTAPNHLIIIGYVISAHITQGTIFVKVDNGYELDELHNVKIDAVTNNEVLAYTSATDIWENKTPSEAGLQPTLVSATNIKTINGNTILGSGDLVISGTGISSLNGLTGATQTFSIFTTFNGSPSFSSTGTNHQLRLPTATVSTDYGLITNTTQVIGGNKAFPDTIQIPVPAGNTQSCIVLGSAGGGNATGSLSIGSTTVYPNAQEMQYVKGVTSSVQTQLNGKASGLDVAEQTYSLSPAFTGTAPTTISSSTYKYNQTGSLVTVRVNLIYTTAGSITQVVIPLPTDMPTPLSPTGLSGALDVLYYGVGMFSTLTTTVSTVNRVCFLRRNAANTGYEFVITHSAAVSSRVISLTLQYFT